MFELEHVSKSFSGVPVLREVDLRVAPAETLVLLGPSGCGKSTILRLMLALLFPDSGRVLFDGRTLRREDIRSVRRRVGYVIQDGGLFPHMTAFDNVALPARRLRWDSKHLLLRLDELRELTRLDASLLPKYPLELSGGQRQRVALMRALLSDPDVLLLDEPLASLDPMVRFDLQADLKQIFRSYGKTTVLVTHDLAEAAYFGGTIALMRDGRIVQRGSMTELTEHPADPFVSLFFNAHREPFESLERSL
jgi:osmoprotectant transport system ATP-binding protein